MYVTNLLLLPDKYFEVLLVLPSYGISFGISLQDLKPDVVTYTTLMKALIRVDKYHKV